MAALYSIVRGCLLGFALYCLYVMLASGNKSNYIAGESDSKTKHLHKKHAWPVTTGYIEMSSKDRVSSNEGGVVLGEKNSRQNVRETKIAVDTTSASSSLSSSSDSSIEQEALKKLRELKKEKKRLRRDQQQFTNPPSGDIEEPTAVSSSADRSSSSSNNNNNNEDKNKKLEEEIRAMQCAMMREKHHVVPGVSWGTLELDMQRKWTRMRCDSAPSAHPNVPTEHDTHSPNAIAGTTADSSSSHRDGDAASDSTSFVYPSFLPSWMHLPSALQPAHAPPPDGPSASPGAKNAVAMGSKGVGLPLVSDEKFTWCTSAREKYKVQPMKSWGSLPTDMIESWKSKSCDLVFTSARMSKRGVTTCAAQIRDIVGKNAVHSHDIKATQYRLIAVMAATTTRKVHNPSPDNLALFTYLLPSLIRSVDCGYRYEYVLGYDKGDPFYDSEAGAAVVKEWFRVNIQEPMEANGVSMTIRMVRVNNTLRKPGPVFIEMARAAYTAGADYFYRINDDTELVEHWPSIFVGALEATPYPHGVVGPLCQQGNRKILTHDFVHRTHMEIFEMNYYPTELTDWWMDDWISLVYGRSRTYKAHGVTVVHHTGAHGQRYEVDRAHEKLLGVLVTSGRKKIRQFMLSRGVSESELKEFDEDRFDRDFVHKDVPGGVRHTSAPRAVGRLKRHIRGTASATS